MDYWFMPPLPEEYDKLNFTERDIAIVEETKEGKKDLLTLLEKANCEHIYETSTSIYPSGARISIEVPASLRFCGYEWEEDNKKFYFKI